MAFDPVHEKAVEDSIKALQAAFQVALALHPENVLALRRQLDIDIAAALAA